jgi:HEAT repeat protein
VRSAVAGALSSQASLPAVRDALLARLGDKISSVRSAVAGALSSQASLPAVRDALLARLGDEDSDVRYAVAGALSHGIFTHKHGPSTAGEVA